jgi:hypothetical protein
MKVSYLIIRLFFAIWWLQVVAIDTASTKDSGKSHFIFCLSDIVNLTRLVMKKKNMQLFLSPLKIKQPA